MGEEHEPNWHMVPAGKVQNLVPAEALTTAQAEIEALRAENAALKDKALGFIAVWADRYARDCGLPDGHLHPQHFDLIAEFGGNTDSFVRAALSERKP